MVARETLPAKILTQIDNDSLQSAVRVSGKGSVITNSKLTLGNLGTTRVSQGFTQFYLLPNTSHTCLYSPATAHHHQRSIKFKGSCLWYSLPDELKSVISAQSFAKQLKKFMIDKSLVPL